MVWMVLSSFKSNSEIFRTPFALPERDRLLAVGPRPGRSATSASYALNSAIVTAAIRGAHPDLRRRPRRSHSAGTASAGAALLMGVDRARAAAAAAVVLHRPVAPCSRRLEITDTRWALIIPYTAMGMPLAVYLLKVYLDALPEELFEAARIDGAGDVRLFWTWPCRCCVPVSRRSRSSRRSPRGTSSCSRCSTSRTTRSRRSRPACWRSRAGTLTDYALLFSALSIITHPDDRHLHRLQPPDRRRHHGRQPQVGSGADERVRARERRR